MKALDELTAIFYTEKAQNAYANAEALIESKPREAIEALTTELSTAYTAIVAGARPALRRNVRFHASCAEAELAGTGRVLLRPSQCRCQRRLTPGQPVRLRQKWSS